MRSIFRVGAPAQVPPTRKILPLRFRIFRPPHKGEVKNNRAHVFSFNAAANFSNAFARWLMECLSFGSISPNV